MVLRVFDLRSVWLDENLSLAVFQPERRSFLPMLYNPPLLVFPRATLFLHLVVEGHAFLIFQRVSKGRVVIIDIHHRFELRDTKTESPGAAGGDRFDQTLEFDGPDRQPQEQQGSNNA